MSGQKWSPDDLATLSVCLRKRGRGDWTPGDLRRLRAEASSACSFAATEITRLRDAMAPLAMTGDGVPLWVGMPVWYDVDGCCCDGVDEVTAIEAAHDVDNYGSYDVRVGESAVYGNLALFSTRDAWQDAKVEEAAIEPCKALNAEVDRHGDAR